MISFTVHGVPETQGSKRAFVVKGRAVVTESGRQRHKDWRARVAHDAQEAMNGEPLLDGPVQVTLIFRLAKPESAPKRRRTWPIGARSGDLDKLARSCLDSMTAVVFHDDAQVVQLGVHKDYGAQPGVTINVAPVEAHYVHPEPSVCVCDTPDPVTIGECRLCQRPFRPSLMELRDEWRTHLNIQQQKEQP